MSAGAVTGLLLAEATVLVGDPTFADAGLILGLVGALAGAWTGGAVHLARRWLGDARTPPAVLLAQAVVLGALAGLTVAVPLVLTTGVRFAGPLGGTVATCVLAGAGAGALLGAVAAVLRRTSPPP